MGNLIAFFRWVSGKKAYGSENASIIRNIKNLSESSYMNPPKVGSNTHVLLDSRFFKLGDLKRLSTDNPDEQPIVTLSIDTTKQIEEMHRLICLMTSSYFAEKRISLENRDNSGNIENSLKKIKEYADIISNKPQDEKIAITQNILLIEEVLKAYSG